MLQKEESQRGQTDPIVAMLKRGRLQPTVKNYVGLAYPDQEVEDLDAEAMQQVNEALGLEEQKV